MVLYTPNMTKTIQLLNSNLEQSMLGGLVSKRVVVLGAT